MEYFQTIRAFAHFMTGSFQLLAIHDWFGKFFCKACFGPKEVGHEKIESCPKLMNIILYRGA